MSSVDVSEGMILGIIGPNGAGKTTAFNLLNGFLRPDTGEILLHGRSVVGLEIRTKRAMEALAGLSRSCGPFRGCRSLKTWSSVLSVHARDEKDARRFVEKAIDKVGLASVGQTEAALLVYIGPSNCD